MIGHILGNYKIEQKLGEGGMGAVYRGLDLMLEREVAIKALRPELGSQPQVVERFRSEAVTLAKLNHPNIATLYSFFRQADDYYMVLEYVRGVTLDNLIQQRGALPSEQAIPLFCQVLDGIDHAHRFGIIHRDIKPANMMLTEAGTLKVLDFGIARILGTARMTKQGHLIGTIEYMSPEQVRGMETDARSDIYSLGMLLYEMLTGRVPFQIENEFELMKAQIEQTPVAPRLINASIPAEVEGAIMRAIAKNPDERFQTAGDFRTELLTAGFGATGARIDPMLPGSSPYATRPISHPPFSNPAVSRPPASGEAAARAMQTGPAGAAASQPSLPPSTDGGLKETRIGAFDAGAGAATAAPGAAAASGQLKETRIGAPPAFPQPAAPPPPAPPQSFFSKLTWVHYAGAGVAALVLLVVVVAVPLGLFVFSGSKKPTPTPAPTTEAQTTTPPPVTREEPAKAPVTDAAGAQTGSGSSVGGSELPATTTPAPTTQPVTLPPVQAAAPETPAGAQPKKPAAKPPAKPRPDAAAEAARRKREAALRALDQ